MLKKLLDEPYMAVSTHEKQRAGQLTGQLVHASGEAVEILIKALRQPGKFRQAYVIGVLHLIGYPQNAPAIPELIYHLGDPNLPGWKRLERL